MRPTLAPEPVLRLQSVEAGYGPGTSVLIDFSLDVYHGEVVCLMGANGSGKSTAMKVASGLVPPRKGKVFLKGEDVTGWPAHKLLRLGLAHVLQGRSVFPEMTVKENVLLGGYLLRDKKLLNQRIESLEGLFPLLPSCWHKPAGLLSAGQQKVVELSRAIVMDVDVLLLDEPSSGLDVRSVQLVLGYITTLREAGNAVLVAEQNVRSALEVSDRGCVLDGGRIQLEKGTQGLLEDPEFKSVYLGI